MTQYAKLSHEELVSSRERIAFAIAGEINRQIDSGEKPDFWKLADAVLAELDEPPNAPQR